MNRRASEGGRPKYPSTVCILEPHACPNDPAFEHHHYYGCIPRDFSPTTGRSKTNHQVSRRVDGSPLGFKYQWNGGCDAAGASDERPLCEWDDHGGEG